MDATADADLDHLADRLALRLRRDAAALESDRAADLMALATLVDDLLRAAAASPETRSRRRVLLHVLSEVEGFHQRLRASHGRVRASLQGAADRRLARLAYGDAQRRGDVGADA